MSAHAQPIVVAGDRTHYLHTSTPLQGDPDFVRHRMHVDGTEVALLRWRDREHRPDRAVLQIDHGPLSVDLDLRAEHLRTIAYAMLQCASELDAANPMQEAA